MSVSRIIMSPGIRLSQQVVSRGQLYSGRYMHTTAVSNDVFSWLRNRKKTEPVKSTKDVISEIEAGKDLSKTNENVTTLELTPDNFIGKFDKKKNVIPLDTVPFNYWLSSTKVASEEELNTILVQAYNETFGTNITNATEEVLNESFKDITEKFKFAKQVQAKSGFILSDYQFTVLSTPISFREYYLKEFVSGKALRFKESEPNAIHLNSESFKAPNIRVMEDIPEKVVRSKFKKIVKEVDAIESTITKNAIENAKEA